jgi:alpha-mannosidase
VGTQRARYALVPHRGKWDAAALSAENARWVEPLLAGWTAGQPHEDNARWSLVTISGEGIEIPTMMMQEKELCVRLYNAEGDSSERTISFACPVSSVSLVELDGSEIRTLEITEGEDGHPTVRLALPRFGLRTLKCVPHE